MRTIVVSPLFFLIVCFIFLLAVGGWVANVCKMFAMLGGDVSALFVARIVGIFAFPLGSVLGFF